ncbi:MAG: DinB family protein [Acidobacteria bacterium]|nr:DinB family protein [Acidobacteriota bacterium]MBI3422241.1 DinB family protein [Acidobacteriota bacterium]
MIVNDLISLYDYGYWVNRKLFQVLAQLTPEEFTQPVAGSYGSIRNTLVHVLSAEWGWLDRCGGPARSVALKGDDYPTLETLRETWGRVEGYVREFLSGLKDEDLTRVVEFTLGPTGKQAMPLGELLHHAAIHGVHHRGQVALLLRMLGYTPGNFDILFYYAERRAA